MCISSVKAAVDGAGTGFLRSSGLEGPWPMTLALPRTSYSRTNSLTHWKRAAQQQTPVPQRCPRAWWPCLTPNPEEEDLCFW